MPKASLDVLFKEVQKIKEGQIRETDRLIEHQTKDSDGIIQTLGAQIDNLGNNIKKIRLFFFNTDEKIKK